MFPARGYAAGARGGAGQVEPVEDKSKPVEKSQSLGGGGGGGGVEPGAMAPHVGRCVSVLQVPNPLGHVGIRGVAVAACVEASGRSESQ
jgi:hypothetical protein